MASALVQYTFGLGVDQKTDSHHLGADHLLQGVNIRQDKYGALKKRPGWAALASLPTAGTGRLVPYRDELVGIDGVNLCSYVPARAAFVTKDRVSEATVRRTSLAHSVSAAQTPDVATGGGYTVYVWCTAPGVTDGDIYMSVIDAVTGAELVSARRVLADDGTFMRQPRVVWTGGFFVITCAGTNFGPSGNANKIYAVVYTPSTDTVSARVTLVTDNTLAGVYDISSMPSANAWVLVYRSTGPAITAKLYDASTNLTTTRTTSEVTAVALQAIAVKATASEQVWIAYSWTTGGSTLTKCGAFEPTLTTETVAPTLLFTAAGETGSQVAIERVSATRAAVVFTNQTAAVGLALRGTLVDVTGGGAAGTITLNASQRRTYWTQLASKPFVYSGRVYAWTYVGGARAGGAARLTSQWSTVLLDLGLDDLVTAALPGRPVALAGARISEPESLVGLSTVCSVVASSTQVDGIVRVLKAGDGRTGLALVEADYADPTRWQDVEMGDVVHLSGGLPSYYDGSRLGEIGFLFRPESATLTQSVGAGLANGTYLYICVYEWVDARGNIHRSLPSTPQSITTTGANGVVTLVIPSYGVTTRQNAANAFLPEVRAVVYRTVAGSVGPFYRLDAALDGSVSPACSPLVETVTAVDTLPDSFITTSPQLYTGLVGTQEAVVENASPASCSALVAHRNRLFTIDDDGRTIRFTKLFVEGEALSFADEFTLPLDVQVTALQPLDGTLYAFSRSRIYAIDGDGPADSAQGGSFEPRRLATDLGSISGVVLQTPMGLVFRSSAGLYLLDRSGQVSYFSQAVEDTLTAFPTVTSAFVHPAGNNLIWSVNGPTYGAALVYDYRTQQWGTDERFAAAAGQGARVLSSCVLAGSVYVLRDNGTAYLESGYLDAGTFVPRRLETGNLKVSGVQGYFRAWALSLLADKSTGCDLRVSVAFDYAATFDQVEIYTAEQLESVELAELPVTLKQQNVQAVRALIEEIAPTYGSMGSGQGPSFIGLAFRVGIKQGLGRRPAAARR